MKDFNDKPKKFRAEPDEIDYDEPEKDVDGLDAAYNSEEEYDDNEFDDEAEYDDDGEYDEGEEEPYDEDDEQYYDDRLSQVLEELADLKRNMSSTDYFQPQYAQNKNNRLYNGGDTVLYNEISRLRDELNRTQSTQNLHVEMSRLKEEMNRDKLRNETVFVDEIKRLNKKIESLQNGKALSLDVSAGQEETALPHEPLEELSNENFEKLVHMNESILNNLQTTEKRLQSEMNAIQTRFDNFGSLDALNHTVMSIRKSVRNLKEQLASVVDTMQNTEEFQSYKCENQLLNKLDSVSSKIAAGETADLSGLIKLVYELKALIGASDESEKVKLSAALKIYNALEKVKEVLLRSFDFKEKLFAVDEFMDDLGKSEFVNTDLVESAKVLVTTCMQTLLTRPTFDALATFAENTGKIVLSLEKQENIKKYLTFSKRTEAEEILTCIDFLPELVTTVDKLQEFSKQDENNGIYLEISSLNSAYVAAEDEGQKNFLRSQIKQNFMNLTSLTVGEIVLYKPDFPTVKETFIPQNTIALTERIDELKSLIGAMGMNSFVHDDNHSTFSEISEMSSLRQQLLSASSKDEILDAVATIKTNEPIQESDNSFYANLSIDANKLILKELSGIKEKLELTENYDLLTEILSLREDVKTTRILNMNDVSSELEGLKGELLKLKSELTNKTYYAPRAETLGVADGENAPTSDELNLLLSEIVSLRDEIQSYKDDVNGFVSAQKQDSVPSVPPQNDENFTMILDELTGIRSELQGIASEYQTQLYNSKAEQTGGIAAMQDNLFEIKDMIARRTSLIEQDADRPSNSNELNVVLNEIINLKKGLNDVTLRLQDIANNEVCSENRYIVSSEATGQSDVVSPVILTEIACLREQLMVQQQEMKDWLALLKDGNIRQPFNAIVEPDAMGAVTVDFAPLMAELHDLKKQLARTADNTEPDTAVLDELLEFREEMERMRNAILPYGNSVLSGSIESIQADLRSIKEEPNLSVMNEVLALRDEFQAFKDELNKTRTAAPKEDTTREVLLKEVQSLRDQMFAISMANVNDGTSNELVYESYNNIILDEISALRDEVNAMKQNDATAVLTDEIAQIKEAVANLAVDEREAHKTQFVKLTRDMEELKKRNDSDDTRNSILTELHNLKQEIANQRDADAASLDYMSEMAHLLQRQNECFSQPFHSKLSNEIESLKVEIASSLAAERGGYPNALSRKKNDSLAEPNQPYEVSGNEELNQKTKIKPTLKKRNSSARSGFKKAADKLNNDDLAGEELPTKTHAANKETPRENFTTNLPLRNDGSLNANKTENDLLVASKLAKQVANKLIMEQLVQQLGEGEVSSSKVEEIVKDILPQEFSTVQIDEQSDEVRRLANSLVLDKLRSRLLPKK